MISRYGDLLGKVEIDGHAESPLRVSLANMPPTYYPIGIEVSLFESFDSIINFAILAYDLGIVGDGANDAEAYVQTHGQLPVRRFTGSLHSSTAHKYFKRCIIIAVDSRAVALCDKLQVNHGDAP